MGIGLHAVRSASARVLTRWWGAASPETAASLRRRIERQFLFRGATTLRLRELSVDGDEARVAFYARPMFPDDRRMRQLSREAAFADQLFGDMLTILRTCREAGLSAIEASGWITTVDGAGAELRALRVCTADAPAAALLDRGHAARLGAYDILRRLGAVARIDRSGALREEHLL
jgi:hypothetical protein